MPELSLVHLVRAANGPEPLRRFLEAFARAPPGIDCEIVFCLKGFSTPPASEIEALLDRVPHTRVAVADTGFDIDAYRAAAKHARGERIAFTNSFSEPLVAGWLALLDEAARRDGVGAAGATGSWESALTETIEERRRQRRAGVPAWRGVLGIARVAIDWPPFPNPHLRTNGFLIHRALFLALDLGSTSTKSEVHAVESGRRGLTRQLQRRGHNVVVVDAAGRSWSTHEWDESRTFRRAKQEGLLLADNRTREYADASPERRLDLEARAWGRRR